MATYTSDAKNSSQEPVDKLFGKVKDIQDVHKLTEVLSWETDVSILEELKGKAISKENYELARVLKNKIDQLNSTKQVDAQKKEQEHKNEMNKLKEEESVKKQELLKNLVAKLQEEGTGEDKKNLKLLSFTDDYETNFSSFLTTIKTNTDLLRKALTEVIEDETLPLDNKKEEIRRINALKDNLLPEKLPSYNAEEIKNLPLVTARLWFKKVQYKEDKESKGETAFLTPKIRLERNMRSRRRLNRTIKKFNKIGDDPERAMRYFLSKRGLGSGKWLGALHSVSRRLDFRIYKFDGFVMSLEALQDRFEKNKADFIQDLESNLSANMSDQDKKIIEQLKNRLDYYYKAYIRKHYNK